MKQLVPIDRALHQCPAFRKERKPSRLPAELGSIHSRQFVKALGHFPSTVMDTRAPSSALARTTHRSAKMAPAEAGDLCSGRRSRDGCDVSRDLRGCKERDELAGIPSDASQQRARSSRVACAPLLLCLGASFFHSSGDDMGRRLKA